MVRGNEDRFTGVLVSQVLFALDTPPILELRELIIETQRYDSSDDVFSMYLIIETKYICQKQDKQHNE